MKRTSTFIAVLLVFTAAAIPTGAYSTFGVRVNGRVIELKWARQPIRYFITNRGVPDVSADAFRGAAGRAFATWQGIDGVGASSEFGGFTSAEPFDEDGIVTLGFRQRADLDRVLGATNFLVDDLTGELLESDIFINSTFGWSVVSGGQSGRFDLESILLHEIGHLLGLGHSAVGETELNAGGGRRVLASEAVMFPIAFSPGTTAGRTPRADDISGLLSLYAEGGTRNDRGGVSGRVTKDGEPVFGAHVVAFNPRTGAVVGGITNEDGRFSISMLEPGSYIVRAEPLDDAELDSFFDDDDAEEVDLDFRVAYHDRLAVAPRGGGSSPVTITVVAR
jgi:hypothetical protein